MLSQEETEWHGLVSWVDRGVKRLTHYQRDLIRIRYLCEEPASNDQMAHDRLRAARWYVGMGYYMDEKQKALESLSARLRVVLDNVDHY